MNRNEEAATIQDFGDEWSRYDQSDLSDVEAREIFEKYFAVFPMARLNDNAVGFDLGCGSGRWAKIIAPKVLKLHCIDPSDAIVVARQALKESQNVEFHRSGVDDIPLPNDSMDFGYSLGVLHHVPDTLAGIRACVAKLKTGAPLLLYLYYRFDNRPWWYRALWSCSDMLRRIIVRLPSGMKAAVTTSLAVLVYWPFSRTAKVLSQIGMNVESFPLAFYKDRSFYTMRTDARDRFGTHLEKRFTRTEIQSMMVASGLHDIRFSDKAPYWCAVGYKQQ